MKTNNEKGKELVIKISNNNISETYKLQGFSWRKKSKKRYGNEYIPSEDLFFDILFKMEEGWKLEVSRE